MFNVQVITYMEIQMREKHPGIMTLKLITWDTECSKYIKTAWMAYDLNELLMLLIINTRASFHIHKHNISVFCLDLCQMV